MKVLFVARTDWTNFGYNFSKALNYVGVTSKAAYMNDNTIGPKGIQFKKLDDILQLVEEADVVIVSHTTFPISISQIEKHIIEKNKKFLVLHGGSQYRQNAHHYNSRYSKLLHATLVTHDLAGMGAKNEFTLTVPVDTDFLQPIYHHRDKLIVANYPTKYITHPHLKGADIIAKAMTELSVDGSFEFRNGTNTIPWEEHIKRIKECDVYIESIGTQQKGIPLTMYGVVAAEAAALGKIVIGKFDHYEDFEKNFAPCKIFNAYDRESIINVMTTILSMNKRQILRWQEESREWAVSCHSYKAVGERLKNIIGEI